MTTLCPKDIENYSCSPNSFRQFSPYKDLLGFLDIEVVWIAFLWCADYIYGPVIGEKISGSYDGILVVNLSFEEIERLEVGSFASIYLT